MTVFFTLSAQAADVAPASAKPPKETEVIKAPEVEVKGQRFRVLTPMPGVAIEREEAATNIQSATGKDIAESRAVNVTEFMNGQMQSVSVNDYAGNPFQQDLNFRGFTASPAIGTPQGISVYLDGVRVNEAFGEVVNWDFLPMNAIASLDLIPGSNPLFGLNTLGGALALRTKNGFTDARAHAEYLTGSWGRQQVQASNGINNGTLGLFTAYNHFKEDGWRANSPSNVRQIFNSANLRGRYGEINLSALNVDTSLTGNGLVPFELYEEDKKAVFTSPDENKNSLEHYNLNGRADLTDYLTVSALTYRRSVKQQAISADFYDQFPDLSEKLGGVPGLTQCADGSNPDGNPNSANPGTGCSGLLPNGVFSTSDLKQGSKGYALQLNFLTEKHQFTTGATYDSNNVNFMQGELFGEINADREVVANPEKYFDNPDLALIAAKFPIIRNKLQGSSTTKSIFFSDTWSPKDNLHFTFGARYNHTRVKNDLRADLGNALYQFQAGTSIGDRFLDPALQVCTTENPNGRFFCTKGDYLYRSFNPSLGASWVVTPELNVYGNLSRGARTPSVIELGCAIDPAQIVGSTNFQFGCSIPTSLTADPYLKQVRSTSYEVGTRGNNSGLNWNMSFFRTELKDDILFVPLGRKNRGVFDNFGETLRQGIETGVSGKFGNDRLSLNYTYLRATFESPSTIINPNNSSNVPSGAQNYVYISPGDDLPGMPRHIVQANWNHAFTPKFDVTLNMVLHSSSYVRGNENNKHEARAATNVVLDGFNRDPYDYTGDGSIPGYAVFNLRATYKFEGGFTLFAKADNLFDRDYATAGNLGRTPFTPASGGAAKDASGFNYNSDQWKNTTFVGPGAPRAIWVGLSYDFDWNKRNQKPKDQD